MKRGSLWVSETGMFEFVIIAGSDARQVMYKWADVSGHAVMPQYFAIGYHQSKWSYMTYQEVIGVVQAFD